ncbi:unnamed protein product [Symbiodinium sp. CCMP2592]|nr:unnamed protein product [Symbiodinium sp. CCMP2592]
MLTNGHYENVPRRLKLADDGDVTVDVVPRRLLIAGSEFLFIGYAQPAQCLTAAVCRFSWCTWLSGLSAILQLLLLLRDVLCAAAVLFTSAVPPFVLFSCPPAMTASSAPGPVAAGTLAASDDPKASAPSPPSAAWSDIVAFLPTSDLLRLSAGTLSAISARLAWYDGSTAPALPPVVPTPPPPVGGRSGPPVKEPPAKGASQAAGPIPQQKACPLPHPKLNAPPAAPVRANPLADVASGSGAPPPAPEVTAPAAAPESIGPPAPRGRAFDPNDFWEAGWSAQLDPRSLPPDTYRPTWWPFPDLFCLRPDERPDYITPLAPAEPLQHLALRGYCTHICARLATNSEGNRSTWSSSIGAQNAVADPGFSALGVGSSPLPDFVHSPPGIRPSGPPSVSAPASPLSLLATPSPRPHLLTTPPSASTSHIGVPSLPGASTSGTTWSIVSPICSATASASLVRPPSRWALGTLSASYRPRAFTPLASRPAPAPAVPPPLRGFPAPPSRPFPAPPPSRRHLDNFVLGLAPRPAIHAPSALPAVSDSTGLASTSLMRLPASPVGPVAGSAEQASEEMRLLLLRWTELLKEMGSESALFVEASASAHMDFHVQRVAARFAPSTLQRYFDAWLNWVSFCRLAGANHLSPPPGLLPDWLRSQASKQGLSTMQLKALSWFCKTAGLPAFKAALVSPVCQAFSVASSPTEHRESLPLSLSFVVWLESLVLDPSASAAEILRVGYLLLCIWGSLRWGDALWVPPRRLHYQPQASALVGTCLRTKTTKRGMPFGILASGLLGSASASWALRFLSILSQCAADTMRLSPGRTLDFVPATLSGSEARPVMGGPLKRDKMVLWLRGLLLRHWHLHSTSPPPAAFGLVAAHSLKCTLLAWGRQLGSESELRRIQGHHRLSGSDKSVSLYSRDDIIPMLRFQRQLVLALRSGFRPLQPVARGLDEPLPDFPVTLPAPTGLPSDFSLTSDCFPRLPRCRQPSPPRNSRSNVVHIAVATEPQAIRSKLYSSVSGEDIWLRPICGARTSQLAPDSFLSDFPKGPKVISDTSPADAPMDAPALAPTVLDPPSPSPLAHGHAPTMPVPTTQAHEAEEEPVKVFIRTLLGLSDDTVAAGLVSADAACLRRLLSEAALAAPPRVTPGLSTLGLPVPPASSSVAAKLQPTDFTHLKKDFMAKYPGELLTPSSTPSLEFLSLLKQHSDSAASLWVPWRLRTCLADAARWEETRKPRNDGHPEPVLRRARSLLATALAMLDLVHLATIKQFHEKFLSLALAAPLDQALRSPTLQEILHADRAVWSSVYELTSDHGWSLPDALSEIAFCRGEMSNLLQPRPRPARIPPPPSADGKTGKGLGRKRQLTDNSSGQDSAAAKAKAKAKTAANPPPKGWDPSWCKTIGDKEACMRFAVDKCTKTDCKFVHGCPVPLASGKACGQPHSALDHGKLFLDLFSGSSSPVTTALQALRKACFEPVDKLAASAADLLDDACFDRLCRLCSSGLVGAAGAAPPCAAFSRSRLRPGGPSPVRTLHHPTGIPSPSASQAEELRVSSVLHQRARHLLCLVDSRGGLIWVENPTSSLLWLDPDVVSWLRLFCRHVATVAGCHHGLDQHKVSGKRLADGSFATRLSACYPPSLAAALARLAADVAPFLDDLRSFLHVEDDTTWNRLLLVQEGQPFRLNLWHCLSLVCADPDSGYFDLLRSGVPLGVPEPIPPCPVMHPPPSPDATVIPLQHCESAWKSAIDHADVVDELLEAELAEGWIALVPGGDAELRRRYTRTAVGKLGVVLAEGRPPRLVVDSSVSGVTSNTALPNRSANPTLSDVFFCMPLSDSTERLVALMLDVAKAHRRILIRALDRGLLCFRHRGKLYQCLTLNFGARVSSFYWARAAGLLLRLVHRIVRVRHSAQIYVDDILALLDAISAPLWASLIVVLLLVLRVPMSWHKAALGPSVVWIGWEFNLSHFCVKLDPGKFTRLCALLRQALLSKPCSCHLLERVTGKLLWLSSLFRTFRPSLAPLYSDQHALLPTMTALQPERWPEILQALSPDLILLRPIGVAALPPGSKILRVNQTAVSCRGDLPLLAPDARRIWLQSSSLHTGMCVLSDSSQEVLRLWLDLCQSGTAVRSLLRPPLYVCEAFAHACAAELSAGLGGFARLPDGRQLFFRQSFDSLTVKSFIDSFPGSPRPLLLRPLSPVGNCWRSALWLSYWMSCWDQGTCRCTASSNVTTLLPMQRAGRVCLWPRASARCSDLSCSASKRVAFPFTLITFRDCPMTLQTL